MEKLVSVKTTLLWGKYHTMANKLALTADPKKRKLLERDLRDIGSLLRESIAEDAAL
jgi:hypothetical protein